MSSIVESYFWVNMWLLEQDYSLTSYGIRKRLDLIKQMDRISKNLLHMVSSAGGINSNTACLGEEVDNPMEVDKEPNLILLGKK